MARDQRARNKKNRPAALLLRLARVVVALPAAAAGGALAQESGGPGAPAAPHFGGDFWTRPKLTGDWDGVRDRWAARGFTADLDMVYTFQRIPSGGIPGGGTSSGNTLSGDLVLGLDTTKAELWPGGFFKLRLEGRTGESALGKAGAISPVNIDALFPNSPNHLDDDVFGLTELTYLQFFSPKFGVMAGLLNALDADDNPIAGNARRNATFLNSAFLTSAVEGVVPTVALGATALVLPAEGVVGTFSVMGGEETATLNPFEHTDGVVLATEWTIKHRLAERPGGQLFGFIYAMNKDRTDIARNPRVFIAEALLTGAAPTTDEDTWAFYYNAHQYLSGDEKRGWGPFVRFGFSDGDPNPVRWNVAAGLGGKGALPTRPDDRWGAGVYYVDMSDVDLLKALRVDEEMGAEVFYNIAATPWAHLTLDAQVVDSARPRQDTAWALGARFKLNF
jgi:porin